MPVSAVAAPADRSWLIMAAWVAQDWAVVEPGSEILSRDGILLEAAIFIADSPAVVDSTMPAADLVADLAEDLVADSADLEEVSAGLEEGLVSEDSDAGLDLVLAA